MCFKGKGLICPKCKGEVYSTDNEDEDIFECGSCNYEFDIDDAYFDITMEDIERRVEEIKKNYSMYFEHYKDIFKTDKEINEYLHIPNSIGIKVGYGCIYAESGEVKINKENLNKVLSGTVL